MQQSSCKSEPAELIHRATGGDSIAITVLLTFVYAELRAHLERRVPRDIQSCIDVDDLLQETQIQVFHHIGGFQGRGMASFYRWVATIAMHRLRNAIKAQRALKRGRGVTLSCTSPPDASGSFALLEQLMGPENTPSHCASRKELHEVLSTALGGLPEHYRQVVRLVYLEGRSVEDAAKIMGRSQRAIHNLCYKAKAQLHQIMGSTSRFFSRP